MSATVRHRGMAENDMATAATGSHGVGTEVSLRHVLFPTIAFLFACNPQPDMTGDAGPSECPPVSGMGTMHSGTITAPETWAAAGSPHVIASDTSIRTDITLEACAVVRIGDGKTLDVRGSLVANGLPTRP